MKKTCGIIALIMVCFLIIPSVPCYASDSEFQLRTSDSVSGFWNDSTLDTIQDKVVSYNGDFIDSYYEKLASLPEVQGFSPCMVQRFSRSASGIAQYTLNIMFVDNNYIDDDFEFFFTGNGSGLGDFYCVGNVSSAPQSSTIMKQIQCTWQSNGDFSYSSASGYFYIYTGTSNKMQKGTPQSILWSIYPVYVNGDPEVNNALSGGSISVGDYFNLDRSSWHDFMNSDLPYENEQGAIVDPSPEVIEESNSNHMYLKSCDVGFCKPYSSSDLSSAGGGYLYVNYTYDNWVNSHSSDYWVNIRTVVNVDGTQFSGINTRALDLNGVNVLTFKESTVPNNWTDEGLLFVEFPNTVVSTYKAGYVYSIPYPTFANTDSSGVSNRSRFLGNGRNRLFLTPSGGRGYDITDESLGDFLQSIFDVNVHQRFTITVTVWLQDTNNNRSGEFTKTFNLITGVGTTTDTGITDNDNPFEPDPMLPDIPDGSGNDSNSVAPIVNNFMINGSGTIGYDPGYRDLKEDIDKDPDGNFSQYLDPMQNDDVGSWFMSFVDEMPTEMKSILIAGVGVGVLFGLYRFIRRG